jgi:hypothetical protein
MPGQTPDQTREVLVDDFAARRERVERETGTQVRDSIGRTRTERSEAHRIAAESGNDFPAPSRLKGNMAAKPGG